MSRPILRTALSTLKEAFRDADAITADMLRPPRDRELGPALHASNYKEAKTSLVSALNLAIKIANEDEDQGDPSGSGGAGPAH